MYFNGKKRLDNHLFTKKFFVCRFVLAVLLQLRHFTIAVVTGVTICCHCATARKLEYPANGYPICSTCKKTKTVVLKRKRKADSLYSPNSLKFTRLVQELELELTDMVQKKDKQIEALNEQQYKELERKLISTVNQLETESAAKLDLKNKLEELAPSKLPKKSSEFIQTRESLAPPKDGKYSRLANQGFSMGTRRLWTQQEDEELFHAVKKHGVGKWASIKSEIHTGKTETPMWRSMEISVEK